MNKVIKYKDFIKKINEVIEYYDLDDQEVYLQLINNHLYLVLENGAEYMDWNLEKDTELYKDIDFD